MKFRNIVAQNQRALKKLEKQVNIYIKKLIPNNRNEFTLNLLLFTFTTTLCESGFSNVNQIKNEYRNLIKLENLQNLLFLALYQNFEFDCRALARERTN